MLHKTQGVLGFVRKTFLLATLGLIVSVCSLIVLNSINNGYKKNLETKLIDVESHLEIKSDRIPIPSDLADEIETRLKESNHLKSFHRILNGKRLLLVSNLGSHPTEVVLPLNNQDIFKNIYKTDLPKEEEIVIGESLKERLNIEIGDKVKLFYFYNARGDKKGAYCTVKSFFNTGTHKDDNMVILNKKTFEKLFYLEANKSTNESVSSIKIYLNNFEDQEKIKEEILEMPALSSYEILTFNQKHDNLLESLDQIFQTISIIISFFVLLAILNISSSIFLVIESKEKQIKFLRLTGMSRFSISSIFILISLSSIVISFFAGYFLAEILIYIQNTYQIISISSDVYIISHLVGIMDYSYILSYFIIFIILGLIFSLIPSYRATLSQY